ncbi:hypothetical protein VNO77_00121 [Canavalia gladiata]|uniref:Uncharacterized protein n=1 Tax=Canavalia gladiata TaxID=3824 RepID=A0AAN9MQJ0_CANGL
MVLRTSVLLRRVATYLNGSSHTTALLPPEAEIWGLEFHFFLMRCSVVSAPLYGILYLLFFSLECVAPLVER